LIGLELGTTLIKGYGVSVSFDEGGRSSEGKFLWFESDGANRIPFDI
jgi:hypothetical protein